MADKLNGMRLRLCAVVWELLDMELITQRGADAMLERIEELTWQEAAALMRGLLAAEKAEKIAN